MSESELARCPVLADFELRRVKIEAKTRIFYHKITMIKYMESAKGSMWVCRYKEQGYHGNHHRT